MAGVPALVVDPARARGAVPVPLLVPVPLPVLEGAVGPPAPPTPLLRPPPPPPPPRPSCPSDFPMSGRLCARGPYRWSEAAGRRPPAPARGRVARGCLNRDPGHLPQPLIQPLRACTHYV
nr:MAG TPA: hypothetical protein [Caudoviricetes sp.]